MGNNYPNQQGQNYNNNNVENISFPTEYNYGRFEPGYTERPSILREKAEMPVYEKKKGNAAVIVLLSVLIALLTALLTALLVVVLVVNNKEESPADEREKEIAAEERSAVTEEAEDVASFEHYSTYNLVYTYTDMPDIYNSTESADEKCFEMSDFITDFNNAWIEYVNYGNTGVYSYLRAGTKPYQYAINYGEKNLTEEYQTMAVNDVREYNGSYYVWTYEVINKYYDGKTEQAVYHWIYKIAKDGGGYYVELYKKDPYYN